MKPIDRLAIIKQQQRALRVEARVIRAQLLCGEASLEGDDHIASIQRHVVLRRMADHVGNGVSTTSGARAVWEVTRNGQG